MNKLISLDLAVLRDKFSSLILDYDGVLCEQGENTPKQEVLAWLKSALAIFGDKNIFIFSNNPTPERQKFFNEYFQHKIIVIVNKLKPYPDGIAEIYNYCKLATGKLPNKAAILMVDDRLATGILAAKIFGIAACLITKPYTNFTKRFIMECWFLIVRKVERLVLWLL